MVAVALYLKPVEMGGDHFKKVLISPRRRALRWCREFMSSGGMIFRDQITGYRAGMIGNSTLCYLPVTPPHTHTNKHSLSLCLSPE